MIPTNVILLIIQLASTPDIPDGVTARLYVCGDQRPGKPHGNTIETDRARIVINESHCKTI
jgi:hypothetical protein